MAFSATKKQRLVVGNKYMEIWEADFDGVTSGDIVTGLKNIDAIFFNNETSETDGLCQKNNDASGANPGSVKCTGFTSDDVATVTVIGV